jgi:serine protease Do
MKRYFIYLTASLTLTAFAARAQQGQSQGQSQSQTQVQIQEDKDQDSQTQDGKTKVKRKGYKEIIIKSDDKDKKTVIVIDGGKVTIDGKPMEDWKDGSISIRRMPDFPGFNQGEPFTFNFDFPYDESVKKYKLLQDVYDPKKVRLGVYTKENEKGAEITQVIDSSAAAKAGLQKGDIITKVGESPISDPGALSKVVRDHQPNDKLTVNYIRDGKEAQTQVTLDKPREMEWRDLVLRPDVNFKLKKLQGFGTRRRLGAHIQDTEDTSGVKVLQIDPESPAATAGLQKDDVITSIDGKKVTSIEDAMDVLGDEEDKFTYPITVNRAGQSLTLQVKIPHELRSANL